MVDLDFDCKAKMPSKSPKLSNKLHVSIPTPFFRGATKSPVSCSDSDCSDYEQYLRLPELRKLCSSKEFPNWKNEALLKPTLQALEITFRFVSIILSDPRPHANRREFIRRLESLASSQIQLIASLCEDEDGTAPIVDLTATNVVLSRAGSSAEVWKIPGAELTLVNRTSEQSLLPRLATWQKSQEVAEKIMYTIECEMRRCPYTLGLGEPNLAGKPNLEYDAVCRPNEIYALKKNPYDRIVDNHENQVLYTTYQILESWIVTMQELLKRIVSRIESKEFEEASSDCYLLERIWKLLAEIEDLHLLMDPDDLLRLKNQLSIRSSPESVPFCFRSRGLVDVTKLSKDLKHKVPEILGVEVDPSGGPRVQETAMRLYCKKKDFVKIHLLQSLQAVEAALKRFYFAYKQVLVVVMGSLEAKANRVLVNDDSCDSLSHIFLEPTYFPSLDAAKTFLGELWSYERKH